MLFLGSEDIVTRIVCGYNPCVTSPKAKRSTYQQHRRYLIEKEKDLACPRKQFHHDLVQKLKQWCEQGDRLIVCMDANKHIYKKGFGKSLTRTSGLAMNKVVGTFTNEPLGATFF